eukprot:TCONS_00046790-protein
MEEGPYMWTVDYYGSLHKLNLSTMEFQRLHPYDPSTRRNTFKRISSSTTCMWGIGGDQNVYMMVFKTDSPIIAVEHCYENQRWYVGLGFSEKSLISTDRPHWSSKDGKTELKRENFRLPNDRWQWEGDWYLDKTIQCDTNGWEYALDFPREYYGYKAKTSFVRRRRWIRKRKFIDFDTWTMIPTLLKDDPFHDISVGGNLIPGQTQGFLSVWATTLTGRVFYRQGVSRTCLEGESWVEIPMDDFNLVQISVGSSGRFWGVTWDGETVCRNGIDHCSPSGIEWEVVESPSGQQITQISVGNYALWAVTKEKKVYFRSIGERKESQNTTTNKGWKSMIGEFLAVTVSSNDQVVALSPDGLFIRTRVTADELVGREWKKLNVQENVSMDLMCSCISMGSTRFTNTFIQDLGKLRISPKINLSIANTMNTNWRRTILKEISQRNTKDQDFETSDLFQSATSSLSKWNKHCYCKCLVDPHYDIWVDAHLKIVARPHEQDATQTVRTLFVYYSLNEEFKEWTIDIQDLACVFQLRHASKPYTMALLAYDPDSLDVKEKVVLQFENEKLLNEWIDSLSGDHSSVLDSGIQTIATSALGDIFELVVDKHTNEKTPEYFWRPISGHLKKVIPGWNGICWGFGFDGIPYVRCDEFRPMESQESHVIYENQRWNPVEGFTARLLPSDRWEWSDVTGQMNCQKDSYVLPTSKCRWTDQWTIEYDPKHFDKNGWQYAVDFPWEYHSYKSVYDYVRRRSWKRTCQVTSSGPWEEVKTDVKIQDLAISIEKGSYHVWAVSCYGDVLHRNGVTLENPKGTDWIQVQTDVPVKSISIGLKSRVWCVAEDSSCYVRAGIEKEKTIGSNWLHLPRETQNICHLSIGKRVITAIDDKGIAYVRQDVTDIYPEGTSWRPLWENVTDISVNHLDQVAFVQNGDVLLCLDVFRKPDDLMVILKDKWISICNRGLIGSSYDEQSENESESSSTGRENLPVAETHDEGDLSFLLEDDTSSNTTVDPYSVDIYSFYGNNDDAEG